ncbi:hypothetical protein B5M09_011478 [Aphanomyces astaci]|nr:hypothetical protein B5M09_011478 [Aphanomyces astaci]
MITYNHCVRSIKRSAIQVELFAAKCKSCGGQQEGSCDDMVIATSAELIYTNPTQDLTLLKLKLNPGASLATYCGSSTVNGAVKMDKVIRQLQELNLASNDVLAGGNSLPQPELVISIVVAPPKTKTPETPTTTLKPTPQPITNVAST